METIWEEEEMTKKLDDIEHRINDDMGKRPTLEEIGWLVGKLREAEDKMKAIDSIQTNVLNLAYGVARALATEFLESIQEEKND